VSTNVTSIRKSVTDAGYIVVGLGVMGVDQVKDLVGQLAERADEARSATTNRARTAWDRADELIVDARGRAAKAVDDSRIRVRGLVNRAA
jgi:hypothetical protein